MATKKQNKIIAGIYIGIGTVALLAFAYYKMKGRKGVMTTPEGVLLDATKKPLNLNPVVTTACPVFPLAKGSGMGVRSCEQEAVKIVQMWINQQDYTYSTWVDGKFGDDTEGLLLMYTNQKTVDKAWYEQMKTEVANWTGF